MLCPVFLLLVLLLASASLKPRAPFCSFLCLPVCLPLSLFRVLHCVCLLSKSNCAPSLSSLSSFSSASEPLRLGLDLLSHGPDNHVAALEVVLRAPSRRKMQEESCAGHFIQERCNQSLKNGYFLELMSASEASPRAPAERGLGGRRQRLQHGA